MKNAINRSSARPGGGGLLDGRQRGAAALLERSWMMAAVVVDSRLVHGLQWRQSSGDVLPSGPLRD